MKRSQINACIDYAREFFAGHGFHLPGWTQWTPAEWASKGPQCDEIRRNALGWDITDFSSGDFPNQGLTLVTIRNGSVQGGPKTYCEKIMLVRENQVTPIHFHWSKTEDIINRGGGELCMKLWKADPDERLSMQDVPMQIDGVTTLVKAGETLRLRPGQSITFEPYCYHTFWAEGGDAMVGEVSTVNDDKSDNRFLEPRGRFSPVEEDVPARYVLCNEYSPAEGPEMRTV